jgi:ribosome-associated protein YbcJ (S4-like RNA binding protein)
VFQSSCAAVADFNVQKNEEAEELKGCTPEVHDNVAIDHQREASGSSAMGFP